MKSRLFILLGLLMITVQAWSINITIDSIKYNFGDCSGTLNFDIYATYSNTVDDQTDVGQGNIINGDLISIYAYDGNCNLIVFAQHFLLEGDNYSYPLNTFATFPNMTPPYAPPVSGPFTFVIYDSPGQTFEVDVPIASYISDPSLDGFCTALPINQTPDCIQVAPENIPTLSQWGIIAMFLLLMIFGIVVSYQKFSLKKVA